MTEILLVKTENRVEGMKKIFSHYKDKFSSYQGKRIIIKPNFNTADPPPASTDMSLLKILIEHLNTKNPEKISVIERSGPVDTEETMRSKGLWKSRVKTISRFRAPSTMLCRKICGMTMTRIPALRLRFTQGRTLLNCRTDSAVCGR